MKIHVAIATLSLGVFIHLSLLFRTWATEPGAKGSYLLELREAWGNGMHLTEYYPIFVNDYIARNNDENTEIRFKQTHSQLHRACEIATKCPQNALRETNDTQSYHLIYSV
jgi:hypothetical protein